MSATDELDWTLMFEEERGQTAGVLAASSLQPPPPHAGSSHHHGLRAFDCPSIQITSIANNSHAEPSAVHVGGAEGGYVEGAWPRDQLYLPLDPSYRDPTLCPSPCSSLSSRSWMSDLSSCESFCPDDTEAELSNASRLALGSPVGSPGCGGGAFGVELWQQKYQHPMPFSPALSPFQSPCHSPRTSVTEDSWLSRRPSSRPSSRPTSPFGKRRHTGAARSPSPHRSPTPGASPRGSVTDDSWVGSPGGAAGPLPLMCSYQELDVPSKTRRTAGGQLAALAAQGDGVSDEAVITAFLDSPREEARGRDQLAELYLQVPAHFSWSQPAPGHAPEHAPGHAPLYRSSSPPPLDAPLPSHFGPYQLTLEVQPRSHHRAHYETEGSRGAIKAAAGGHPVVTLGGYSERPLSLQLFIGTADERVLRPHAFYQVHRVTGKTVTTSCQEKMVEGTKVLEVPLLPESNMSASIDCAGILKLRNADIELRHGETDVGRKNTRVRVVFRAAVPQTDGRLLWLQTTSVPVECSQRSGQELPQVQSFSPTSCSVDGGSELLIVGSNISQQSKVVFVEKGADGRTLWEVDASVMPEQSGSSSVAVAIPTYSGRSVAPVQVQFYVSNGKRRRSLNQSFTYLQRVKQERGGQDHVSHNATALNYDAFDFLLHHSPSSHNAPVLHQPIFPLAPPVNAHVDQLLCYVKKEPEEARLQEITLDDVNEVIDRDIGGPTQCNQQPQYGPPPSDQNAQCSWQHAPQ